MVSTAPNRLASLPWPNILTVLRLVLIPVITLLLYGALGTAAKGMAWLAWGLYLLAGLSDWADGYLARRLQQHSAFGVCLDPIADKVLVAILLVALLAFQQLPLIDLLPVGVILSREILVAGLREFLALRQLPMPVTYLAKVKTALQLVAVGVLLLPIAELQGVGRVLLWLSSGVTLYTGLEYALQARVLLRTAASPPEVVQSP
jgi:cardiolipin synthase